MEDRKGILDYLEQVTFIFGIMIMCMILFTRVFGEETKDFSTIFRLGSEGIPLNTLVQFLGVSVLIVAMRYLLFTDAIIKNLSITLRYIFMQLAILAINTIFIIAFKWFPIDMWQSWLMFLLCFAISFGTSIFITNYKEKIDNKKMQEGLNKIKEELREVQDEK